MKKVDDVFKYEHDYCEGCDICGDPSDTCSKCGRCYNCNYFTMCEYPTVEVLLGYGDDGHGRDTTTLYGSLNNVEVLETYIGMQDEPNSIDVSITRDGVLKQFDLRNNSSNGDYGKFATDDEMRSVGLILKALEEHGT